MGSIRTHDPVAAHEPTTTPDAQRGLERRFAAGEADAIREVYAQYAGAVFTVVLSRLGDRRLAEEAVQDVFVKAWRSRARFDPRRSLSPWLYEIARHAAADVARREDRRPRTTGLSSVVLAQGDADAIVDAWEAWQVRCALRDLPRAERELVRLVHYDGMTHEQIAALLTIPLGTVKSRLYRAHRRLAAWLGHLREAEV